MNNLFHRWALAGALLLLGFVQMACSSPAKFSMKGVKTVRSFQSDTLASIVHYDTAGRQVISKYYEASGRRCIDAFLYDEDGRKLRSTKFRVSQDLIEIDDKHYSADSTRRYSSVIEWPREQKVKFEEIVSLLTMDGPPFTATELLSQQPILDLMASYQQFTEREALNPQGQAVWSQLKHRGFWRSPVITAYDTLGDTILMRVWEVGDESNYSLEGKVVDRHGRIMEEWVGIELDATFMILTKSVYSYDDTLRVKEESFFQGMLESTTEMQYDSQGLLVESETRYESTGDVRRNSIRRNERGLPIRSTSESSNSSEENPPFVVTCEYEYW